MDLFSWMVGLPAGWSGGKILKGDGMRHGHGHCDGHRGSSGGRSSHAIAGLGGRWGGIGTSVVAMIGATFLTLLAGFVNVRRLSARQL